MKKYKLNFGRQMEPSLYLPAIQYIEDRYKHLYLIGLSGMGKSTVMENMAHYDLSNGYSVIFIDPKGDSAEKLYYNYQDNQKVRYVSLDNPLTVNLFKKQGYDLDTLIDEFIQIIDNVIVATTSNPESTVRMREIVSQSILGLRPKDRNFQMLYEFLFFKDTRIGYTYSEYEYEKWWTDLFNPKKTGYKKLTDYELSMTGVSSRLFQALKNSKTKTFIEGDNELDIDKLVENGESLIVNIKTSNDFVKVFIANLFVGAILSYMSKQKKTRPLFVYIDEFDLVSSGQFAQSLQLGRSSMVGFTLAHQNFSSSKSEAHKRMMRGIIDSIFGAVSNYVVFNTSPMVARQMSDVFNLNISDFTGLDKYEARLRIGIDKMLIQTAKPKLKLVPDDYVFPTRNNPESSTINFLRDDWIPTTID